MFFYEGQTCPVCGKAFAECDDIVACPQCGCPHHRECWKAEGHCHFEADHGTDRQWGTKTSAVNETPATENRCPHCGEGNPEFAEFCGHCGRELINNQEPVSARYTPPTGNFTPPFTPPQANPYVDANAGKEIEGVPVEDIVELVGNNAGYYLPRFFELSRSQSKISWNMGAFWFTGTWLLYRKNIAFGIPAAIVAIILSCIQELVMKMQEAAGTSPETQRLLAIILFAVAAVELAVCFLLGMFGNYLYMKQILNKARKLKENPRPLLQRRFFEKGGTSLLLALSPSILVGVCTYLYLMISMLF